MQSVESFASDFSGHYTSHDTTQPNGVHRQATSTTISTLAMPIEGSPNHVTGQRSVQSHLLSPTARSEPEPEPIKPSFYFDDETKRFVVDGHPIPITYFTELEHEFLLYLYKNAERLCSYNDITQHVWQGWISSNNIISSAVGRIRRKLNKISEGAGKRYIKTRTGFGYILTLNHKG